MRVCRDSREAAANYVKSLHLLAVFARKTMFFGYVNCTFNMNPVPQRLPVTVQVSVQAAKIFRKQKTREFWNYILFLIVFSMSTLQQRPVEQTHDFISNVVDGTVLGNGYTSVRYHTIVTARANASVTPKTRR